MLEFSVNLNELKKAIDVAASNIDKKSVLSMLQKIWIDVKSDSVDFISIDNELNVLMLNRSVINSNGNSGKIGIDISEINPVTKLKGDIVTFTEIERNDNFSKYEIKCNSKTITINTVNENMFEFTMPSDDFTQVIDVNEKWLLETFTNLSTFRSSENTNKILECVNVNVVNMRCEALDGHRIGLRDIPNTFTSYNATNVLINPNMAVYKKVLDKKSENILSIYSGKKYNMLSGVNFKYYIKVFDGIFFDVEKMLPSIKDNNDFNFTILKNDITEIINYINDCTTKDNKLPITFMAHNNEIFSCYNNQYINVLDKLNIITSNMENNYIVGYNPRFINDVLKILDSDNFTIMGGEKTPAFIPGNEYSFVILPVNISDKDKYLFRLNKVS